MPAEPNSDFRTLLAADRRAERRIMVVELLLLAALAIVIALILFL